LRLPPAYSFRNPSEANMWRWIACYVNGHDYAVGCEKGSMFLRCVLCGRRSQGWLVHHHD